VKHVRRMPMTLGLMQAPLAAAAAAAAAAGVLPALMMCQLLRCQLLQLLLNPKVHLVEHTACCPCWQQMSRRPAVAAKT
jgi:hypothetical protein